VCGAPALPRGGACVFCRSPLGEGSAPPELLPYLASRIPGAVVKRRRFGRGAVRELRVEAGGESFRARQRRGRLELAPEGSASEWVERLVAALTRRAAGDGDLRDALTRAGWALR
jgi:hypothetical protein